MTLNLTIAGPNAIYQCADFRLWDWVTGKFTDFDTQKIILVQTFGWAATVCFAGVGRTASTDVGEWLAALGRSITGDDPLDRLIDGLLDADSWLSVVEDRRRRHSFTVGVFVAGDPLVVLVSNFETTAGIVRNYPDRRLSASRFVPRKPRTFVAGARDAVTSAERRMLAQLAMRGTPPESMQDAMAALNQVASTRSDTISVACFTFHLDSMRKGSGRPHGLDSRPFMPTFAFPEGFDDAVRKLMDEQFGIGRASLKGMSFARSEASEEFHQSQIQANPTDPNAHSNFGAYLHDKQNDLEHAEAEYLCAIELDPKHVNALGNLANLRWEQGRRDDARRLYGEALEVDEGNENISWNFARFLANEGLVTDALEVVDRALGRNPESGRLHSQRGLLLLPVSPPEALVEFEKARGRDPNQADVEAGYAYALHLTGADMSSAIGAYQTAIALAPDNGALRLNLSQLLFILGQAPDAQRELDRALSTGLTPDAEMEAMFYLLAHSDREPRVTLDRINELHSAGARLRWNVESNIAVHAGNEIFMSQLRDLAKAMAGNGRSEAPAWYRVFAQT